MLHIDNNNGAAYREWPAYRTPAVFLEDVLEKFDPSRRVTAVACF